jgi:hypothetical protein
MIINYKRLLNKAMIFTAAILSGFSAWSQQDQSAVKQSADTLNAKMKMLNLTSIFLKLHGYIQRNGRYR